MKRISALWENVFKQHTDDKSIRAVLSRIPIFGDLTKSEIRQIERIVYLRNYREGEIVFVEGEPGAGMYIIESGEVRICLGPNTDKENEIARLGKGDFFGELALIDDAPRSASGVAMVPTRLIGFFRSDLLSIISRTPQIGVKIQKRLLEIIVRRLRITDQRLNESYGEIRQLKDSASSEQANKS